MNREFLYELLETASVSGFEEEIQRKVIKYARGFADEIYTDEIADVVSIERRVVFIRELILDRKSESCMKEMWFTAQSETMAL